VQEMNIGRIDRNYSLMKQNVFQSKGNMQCPSFSANDRRKGDETAMTFQQNALDVVENTERKHKRKRLKQSPKLANKTGRAMLVNGTKQLQQGQTQSEFEPRPCDCNVESSSNAPFYNQLGSGANVEALREMLERSFDIEGSALRIERVLATTKEGKNQEGCPIAKWVLRRSGANEKILVIVRERKGHWCDDTVIVISIVIWDGIAVDRASFLYQRLTFLLREHATTVTRRCGSNEKKNCCCQGSNPETCGASFSFGCSWSMFYNGCKYGNSVSPRKFKIHNSQKEEELECLLENLATDFSQKCKVFAPKAFANMTSYEDVASQCRIGHGKGRPFSGMTCCLDFCAHSHKDVQNMNYGTTMVLTLLKNGNTPKSDDECLGITGNCNESYDDNQQLHVLPFYQLLNEDGSVCETNYKIPKYMLKSKIAPRKDPAVKVGRSPNSKKKQGKCDNQSFQDRHRKVDSEVNIKRNENTYGVKNMEKQLSLTENQIGSIETEGHYLSQFLASKDFLASEIIESLNPGNDVSYIDEKNIPLVFSNNLSRLNSLRKKPVLLSDFTPKRPRLQHIDDLKSIIFRQQQIPLENDLLKPEFKTNGSLADPDLRKRLGFKQLADKDFFPYACDDGNDNDQLVLGALETEKEEDDFVTEDMGGVSIALGHGSILIECAKKEVHATTPLKNPNRQQPTRLSIIFYQHKQLNTPNHGYELNKKKMEERSLKKENKLVVPSGVFGEIRKRNEVQKLHLSDLQVLAEAAYVKDEFSKVPSSYCSETMNEQFPHRISYGYSNSLAQMSQLPYGKLGFLSYEGDLHQRWDQGNLQQQLYDFESGQNSWSPQRKYWNGEYNWFANGSQEEQQPRIQNVHKRQQPWNINWNIQQQRQQTRHEGQPVTDLSLRHDLIERHNQQQQQSGYTPQNQSTLSAYLEKGLSHWHSWNQKDMFNSQPSLEAGSSLLGASSASLLGNNHHPIVFKVSRHNENIHKAIAIDDQAPYRKMTDCVEISQEIKEVDKLLTSAFSVSSLLGLDESDGKRLELNDTRTHEETNFMSNPLIRSSYPIHKHDFPLNDGGYQACRPHSFNSTADNGLQSFSTVGWNRDSIKTDFRYDNDINSVGEKEGFCNYKTDQRMSIFGQDALREWADSKNVTYEAVESPKKHIVGGKWDGKCHGDVRRDLLDCYGYDHATARSGLSDKQLITCSYQGRENSTVEEHKLHINKIDLNRSQNNASSSEPNIFEHINSWYPAAQFCLSDNS